MGYWSGWKAINVNDITAAYDDFDFEDDDISKYVVCILGQSFADDVVSRSLYPLATILVTRNSEQQKFVVSIDVLCDTSTLFRSFYQTRTHKPHSLKLSGCDPKLFEIAVLWLRDQEIDFGQYKTAVKPTYMPVRHQRYSLPEYDRPKPETNELSDMVPRWGWKTLANLWFLAQRLGMSKLQNKLMVNLKPMVESLDDFKKRAFGHFMCDNSEASRGTPLRQLALAQLAVGPTAMIATRLTAKHLARDGFMKELRTYCDRRTSNYPEDKKVEVYFVPEGDVGRFCNITSEGGSDE